MNLEKVSGFKIEKTCLGRIPAQIKGIKVYDNYQSADDIIKDEIIMDCDVSYHGDATVQFTMHSMNAEIKNLSFRGMARIVLKPLINTFPFIFGGELTFIKMPLLDYNLGGIGTFGDLPVVSKIIRDVVENELKQRVLWPNRIRIMLPAVLPPSTSTTKTEMGISFLRNPSGILTIHIQVNPFGRGKKSLKSTTLQEIHNPN